jgi:DNA helicase-2/ATP-dependent DNA helicase PcrA
MDELNPEQLDIVNKGDGPVLVVAGPGSGKTRTLIHRVCKVLESGNPPESILLLTFTNKAAREMKERAERLIGEEASRITAGTFHHFANILLKRHPHKAGLKGNFTIMDEEDSHALLRQAILAEHESVKRGVVESIRRALSLSKLRMLAMETLLEDPEFLNLQAHAGDIGRICQGYERKKRAMGLLDFDDLLLYAHELLQDPGIRGHYQERYSNILVDEFQDTDRLQAAILSLLYRKGNNLMAVGDDSQSIYSFRGAEIRNILEFRERYGAKAFMLVRNYRSTPQIISLINSSISNSRMRLQKELLPVREGGALPMLADFRDRSEEAAFLSERIEAELKEGSRVGVLFRAAYHASELEVELSRKGISYDMRGGVKFFEQRHIKDMLALLKAYHNPRDSLSVIRLLTLFPRIGEKSVLRIMEKINGPSDVIAGLDSIDRSKRYSALLGGIYLSPRNAAGMLNHFYEAFYRKYLEDVFEDHEARKPDIDALIGAASKYPSAETFLDAFSLEAESPAPKDHQLVLSTIHQAKGLEWDSVYILGMAEGMLPLSRSNDLEEERRLFYVAASRAKSSLVMTYPATSGRFYDERELEPSRFLMEIREDKFRRWRS